MQSRRQRSAQPLRRPLVRCTVCAAWPCAATPVRRPGPCISPAYGPERVRTGRDDRGVPGMTSLGDSVVLDLRGLASLLEALIADGRELIGPTVRDGAIVYDELESADELPAGWTSRQPGSYRVRRRDDEARFGYAVGPHSWKRHLLPPRVRLGQIRRGPHGLAVEEEPPTTPLAFIGVRACELRGDRRPGPRLRRRPVRRRDYAARRDAVFVVAVNCGAPGGTCFCVSMGTGPRRERGLRPRADRAARRTGTASSSRSAASAGAEVLARVRRGARPTTRTARGATRSTRRGRAQHGPAARHRRASRTCSARNLEHPRWDEVAERCLTLRQLHAGLPDLLLHHASRTSTDLAGDDGRAHRGAGTRASPLDYSYIHGGSVRAIADGRATASG